MSRFVVAYDVRNGRRLKRVHRLLSAMGFPVEYSIFVFEGTDDACAGCLAKVCSVLDPKHDDLRCFRLPAGASGWHLGKGALPEGIFCTAIADMT